MQFPSLRDHPLFADGAVWSASGWYMEQNGRTVPAEGTIRITRDPTSWIVDRDLRLLVLGDSVGLPPLPGDDRALSLRIIADMDPPQDAQARDAFWTAEDTSLGPLAGRFTVVADSLLAAAASDDGGFVLTDWYLLTEEGCYALRGSLSHDGDTIGAWALTLDRI